MSLGPSHRFLLFPPSLCIKVDQLGDKRLEGGFFVYLHPEFSAHPRPQVQGPPSTLQGFGASVYVYLELVSVVCSSRACNVLGSPHMAGYSLGVVHSHLIRLIRFLCMSISYYYLMLAALACATYIRAVIRLGIVWLLSVATRSV
jgi:hypothetical protein